MGTTGDLCEALEPSLRMRVTEPDRTDRGGGEVVMGNGRCPSMGEAGTVSRASSADGVLERAPDTWCCEAVSSGSSMILITTDSS